MKRFGLATGIYIFLVFLSGLLVGAFAYRLYMVQTVRSARGPEDYRKHYVQEMRDRLKLSGEQVGRLQQIMDETGQRFRDLREKDRPLMKAIEDEQYQKVRAMLDEPQRAEYEKMRAERERRRAARTKH